MSVLIELGGAAAGILSKYARKKGGVVARHFA
jgi:hypothetical protein